MISMITADYTKSQKKKAFFIGMTMPVLIILSISILLLTHSDTFEVNPLAHWDNNITDSFFVKRFAQQDITQVFTRQQMDILPNIVLIKINEDSLNRMNMKWPIPRSVYAGVLEKLKKGHPKTIGFDIIFAEPSEPQEDHQFEKALKDMDNLFLSQHIYVSSETISPEDIGTEKEQEMTKLKFKKPYAPFFNAVGNDRLGLVGVDSTFIRRVLPEVRLNGETGYPLSVLMAAHYMDIPPEKLKNHPEQNYFALGDIKIPTLQNQIRINYFFPNTDETRVYTKKGFQASQLIEEIPIQDILSASDEDMAYFENKLVIIGTTATAAGDIKLSPFGEIPGVFSHINLIVSFLTQKFITPAYPLTNILIILIIGLFFSLVTPRLSPWAGGLLILLFGWGYYNFAYYLFLEKGILMFITAPILCGISGFSAMSIYLHISTQKAKESMSKMFRQFAPVPSPMVENYVEQFGGSAKLGGELVHLTIFFSDIRGYTDMSEKMTSQEVMNLLNEYHQVMGEVFAKTGGVIFTYIGDAQLVVFGLEGDSRINHAAAAIKAGLMMQDEMDKLKQKWEKQDRLIFEVGVGICTGQLSMGVVGSEHLKQFTVIGDTVNVASRVQGMSKDLGAPVLIHERTYLMAKDCIEGERLRPVKLKGKKELVNVYRAKKVLELKPYPGDEVKDLNREVEELHREMEERRRQRQMEKMQERAKEYKIEEKLEQMKEHQSEKGDETAKETEDAKPTRKGPPPIRGKKMIMPKAKSKDEDDLEPLEEKSKGTVPGEDDDL